jgi:hypothetical protein
MMARALSVIGGKLKLMHYCSARLFLREMREDRVCEELALHQDPVDGGGDACGSGFADE